MELRRLQISVLFVLLCQFLPAQSSYLLQIKGVDKDSAYLVNEIGITTTFLNRTDCIEYINKLPGFLQAKGYVTASIDSIDFDSSFAVLHLYLGNKYSWQSLKVDKVPPEILAAVGWQPEIFNNRPLDFSSVNLWQNKILTYLENNGYPFAKIYLDSVELHEQNITANLNVDKGVLYTIDSIRVIGNGKISDKFLQQYLGLPNGTLFSKEKLSAVSKKIKELVFLEEEGPLNLSFSNTGAVLNLYLKQRRSSQMNVLIGLLPNNEQLSAKKMMVTGEANIQLKNAFGAGEVLGLNWQQLQVGSPRLHLLFQYPYLFNSPVGANISFDMFRKDSTFLNINFHLGAQYFLSSNKTAQVFLQRFQTIVNGMNTNYILNNRKLPSEADISATNIGLEYDISNTDYRLNPRKGTELKLLASIGNKKIKKNSQVLALKDPLDPSFDFGSLYDTMKLKASQLRVKATAAQFFPIGKQSTIKAALNGGYFHSPSIFRNELFQIGGYKLLRGFDEESQYLSQYMIGTVEYRLLAGPTNSYFYLLADGGWGKDASIGNKLSYTYFGTGAGLAFESPVGIFNIAWAVGKRSDTKFDLRQSKIHLGFINYF